MTTPGNSPYPLPPGIEVVTVAVPGVEPMRLVSVEAYERMADERDNYRRALALLNAARVTGSHDIAEPLRSQVERILNSVGMAWADGQAIASIAANFAPASARLSAPSEPPTAGSICPEHQRVHNAHGWYSCVPGAGWWEQVLKGGPVVWVAQLAESAE